MLRPVLLSLLNVTAAIAAYWHLITGGWLTQHYRFGDANNVNLLLALFEAVAVAVVLAYWLRQTAFLRRLLFTFAMVQVVIGIAVAAFIIFFMVGYHPKLM